jgi:hypothetical protein
LTNLKMLTAARKALRNGEFLNAPGGLTIDPSQIIYDFLTEERSKLDGYRAVANNPKSSPGAIRQALAAIRRYYDVRREVGRS